MMLVLPSRLSLDLCHGQLLLLRRSRLAQSLCQRQQQLSRRWPLRFQVSTKRWWLSWQFGTRCCRRWCAKFMCTAKNGVCCSNEVAPGCSAFSLQPRNGVDNNKPHDTGLSTRQAKPSQSVMPNVNHGNCAYSTSTCVAGAMTLITRPYHETLQAC